MLQPEYNSVKETLSVLVYTPQGWVQTLNFCLFGILIMLFTPGFYYGIRHQRGLNISLVLIFLMGLGMLLIGVFPTDDGNSITMHGLIHQYTVRAVGLMFPLACALMIPSLKSDLRWKGLAIYTGVAGASVFILIIIWILLVISGLMSAVTGLYERVFVANTVLWLEIMALRLLFLPEEMEKTEREIGILLSRGFSKDFWRNLGESGLIIYSRIKARRLDPVSRSDLLQATKYLAFGALAFITWRDYYHKKRIPNPKNTVSGTSTLSPLLYWGLKRTAKRLGLSPVANLMLSMVKEEDLTDKNR